MSETDGIPPELLPPLRETLGDCEEFESDSRLKAVFDDDRLALWQKKLRRADSVEERVDAIIHLLRPKLRADGANGLVLLLVILRDRTNPGDALYLQLRDLAEKLGEVLQNNVAPRRPHIVEEANPENQPTTFTAELLKLSESVQAVGQVKVPQIIRGQVTEQFPSGTGWLIAPGLAMTCWHVIKARKQGDDPLRKTDREMQATNSVLAFDYMLPGQGIEYRVTALECYDSSLDYALLRLEDRADHPLSKYGFLKLEVEVPLTLQTRLWVIQHPKSQPQQVASGRFVKEKEDQPERIFHNAPTEHGTSGAPVLNVTNRGVVALHSGEEEDEHLREATLLKAILPHIQQTRPNLYNEIMNAR